MSKLPDNSKFSSLTIPGSHNSCSFFGTVIARTQTWSITDQLLSGIRYFDIRLRLYENLLRLQHGITNQYAFFDEILGYFINFLKEYPKEIIFMAVQKEYKDYNNVIQKELHTIKEIGPIEYLKEKNLELIKK